jgi:hypothetical protein
MLSAILWQTALILLLVAFGFDAAAWFVGGIIFTFWFTVYAIAQGVEQ